MMGWVPLFQHIGRQGQEDGQAVSQKTNSHFLTWTRGPAQPKAASIELLGLCQIFPSNVLESERGGICLSEQRSDVDVAQAGCGCWSPH